MNILSVIFDSINIPAPFRRIQSHPVHGPHLLRMVMATEVGLRGTPNPELRCLSNLKGARCFR